jgi:ribonucleoside-diphosphate reductase alpha chain
MTRKKRPDILTGKTLKAKTECGSLFVTLNEMDGELGEVRLNLGKSGGCVRSLLELVGILYSIILQMDIPKEDKIKLFKKHCLSISCGNPFMIGEEKYTSCLDYIGRKCLEELKDGSPSKS